MGGGEETGPWNGYREALGGPAGFPGPRWTVRGRASGLTTKKTSVCREGVGTSKVVRGKGEGGGGGEDGHRRGKK